ncbi:MAG: FHA domain-containing protein [Anaerolineaceae bacterium]|nr:FHA domain-containing protein [Anaerolineaceae bacterium]
MPAQSYRITMRSGPTPGKSFLLEEAEMFLGRDLTNHIAIPDPEISRRHALFVSTPQGVQIEDQGSTNGTFINGVRLTAPQLLKQGDLITFGENIVVVFESVTYDPDATVVASQTQMPSRPVQPVQPAPRVAPSQPVRVPEPVAYQTPASFGAEVPQTPKKKKFPTWLLILLILGAIAACIVGLTLIFMPAPWWCFLTFNSLAGCPIS